MAHKVGDTVTVTRGPHKGDAHKVIHVHKDGRVNVKPHNKMPHQIKYRHGAATASANDVTKMKEETMLSFEAHSWSHDSGWRKPQAQRKDKFGNVVKDKNVAKNLARKAMKKTADNKKESVKEDPDMAMKLSRKAMKKTRADYGYDDKKDEGTIITKPGFKMTNNDKEKLQKIQKMLNRDKAVAKKSTNPGPNEDVDEACWDSHKQVGYKMKGGRRVPNCVPKNENQNAALQKKLSKSAQSTEKGKAAVTLKKAPFRIPSKDDMKNEAGMKRMSTGDGMDTFKKKPPVKKEVLDKDKDHMNYRNKAKTSMDRARNSATAKIVRGDDGVDREKNTMRKRAAGMAMSDRKGVRQFRKFHGYDKKK
jgi:hypothetical protein